MILYTLTVIAMMISFTIYNIFPLMPFYLNLIDAQQIAGPNSSLNMPVNQPLPQQQSPLQDDLMMGSFVNDRISGTANDDIIIALSVQIQSMD